MKKKEKDPIEAKKEDLTCLPFGEWLKKNRLSQKEFVDKTGISASHVNALIHKKMLPSLNLAVWIEAYTMKHADDGREPINYVGYRTWIEGCDKNYLT